MELIKDMSTCIQIVKELRGADNLELLPNFRTFVKQNYLCFRLNRTDYALLELPRKKPVCTFVIRPGEVEFNITEDFFVKYNINRLDYYNVLDHFKLIQVKPRYFEIVGCKIQEPQYKYVEGKSKEMLTECILHHKTKYEALLRQWYKHNQSEISFFHEGEL